MVLVMGAGGLLRPREPNPEASERPSEASTSQSWYSEANRKWLFWHRTFRHVALWSWCRQAPMASYEPLIVFPACSLAGKGLLLGKSLPPRSTEQTGQTGPRVQQLPAACIPHFQEHTCVMLTCNSLTPDVPSTIRGQGNDCSGTTAPPPPPVQK